MKIETLYSVYLQHPLISTDTRKITEGSLFFALKGEHFNGNKFASEALEAGAAYAVIDEAEYQKGDRFLLVDDVLSALQNLARYHRQQLTIPFIAITGTNGKTTTKELLNSVLSQKYVTYATIGNLNNHIGVPLSLLSVTSETEIAIIEMGANHQKEIAFLCSLAQPTHGLINNVGKAHLEGFGGFEGVKKGKGELYDYLKKTNGIAFINKDNDFLMEMMRERELQNPVFYGKADDCFVRGNLVENNPFLLVDWSDGTETQRVKSNLTGTYNFENLMAATAIGKYFGLTNAEINTGIEIYKPTNNRSQITQTATNTLICDYYNANPSSMAVALDSFSGLDAENKVMILGDMFELGEESSAEHKILFERALRVTASKRIFIGNELYALAHTSSGNYFFRSTEEAYELLRTEPIRGATILLKGSRGMKLEKLVELL